MTGDDLRQIGIALFGPDHYLASLENLLGVDRRMMGRMLAGKAEIRDASQQKLKAEVQRRIEELFAALTKLGAPIDR